jgi:hypothetical protein
VVGIAVVEVDVTGELDVSRPVAGRHFEDTTGVSIT